MIQPPWQGGWGRVARAGEWAIRSFFADNGPKLAAAISFHALLSLFPIAILLVAASGLVLRDTGLREDLLDWVLGAIPLTDEGAADLERLVDSVVLSRSELGLLAALFLVWTAGGMMAAVRTALNLAWNVEEERPFFQGKLLDLLLLLFAGALALLSFGLTIAARLARDLGDRVADAIGPLTVGIAFWLLGIIVPVSLSLLTLLIMYRAVPATTPPLSTIWPGAVVVALAFEGLKVGFAVYLENFSDYNAVYGSLGAVIAFLVFVYAAANLFVFGAELSAQWPLAAVPGPDPAKPLGQRVRGALRGLVVRD